MRKFFKNCLFFFIPLLLVCAAIIIYLVVAYDVRYQDLPAPNLSSSYSFNSKMAFVKNKRADIVTIGSSMSLNNVASEVVVDHFKNHSYLNYASWGFNIKEDYDCFQFILHHDKPLVLIMSVNVGDFADREVNKVIDYQNVEKYLSTNNLITDFIERSYTPSYLAKQFEYGKKVKCNIGHYDCLNYDQYGAVMMDAKGFQIDSVRWNQRGMPKFEESNYSYLDSIALLCSQHNIKLIVMHSPCRKGIFVDAKFDSANWENHILKIKKVQDRRNFTFVNAADIVWEDKYFVDANHLNRDGAVLFTQYCLDRSL